MHGLCVGEVDTFKKNVTPLRKQEGRRKVELAVTVPTLRSHKHCLITRNKHNITTTHTHTRVLILTATSQWRHLSCIIFPVMGSIAPWCRAKEQHCLTAEKSANNVNSHPKQRTIQTRILEPSPGLKSWQSECILKSQPTAVRLGTLPLSLPCVAVCIKSHVTIKCHWWFLYGNAAQNSTPSKVLMNAKFSVPGLPAVENAQHWLLLDLGLLPVWELALTVVLISTSLIMTKVEHLFIMAKSCLYLFFFL